MIAFLQIALALILLYLVAILFHFARAARRLGEAPRRRAAVVGRRAQTR